MSALSQAESESANASFRCRAQFSLSLFLNAMLVAGITAALIIALSKLNHQRNELALLRGSVPMKQREVQLTFNTLRTSEAKVLKLNGRDEERGHLSAIGEGVDGEGSCGVSFSAWLVGEVKLNAGFGADSIETQGVLIAVRVSMLEGDTFKPKKTCTNYVVYNGERLVAYEDGAVSVVVEAVKTETGTVSVN